MPEAAAQNKYLSELAETQFEFRISLEEEVVLTCDWHTYQLVKDRFPEAEGYIHEGMESTPWLPVEEVGVALIPVRSLMWDILERDAANYERIAEAQRELMDSGNSVAAGAWGAYKEAGENMRRIISLWRDNYN